MTRNLEPTPEEVSARREKHGYSLFEARRALRLENMRHALAMARMDAESGGQHAEGALIEVIDVLSLWFTMEERR